LLKHFYEQIVGEQFWKQIISMKWGYDIMWSKYKYVEEIKHLREIFLNKKNGKLDHNPLGG